MGDDAIRGGSRFRLTSRVIGERDEERDQYDDCFRPSYPMSPFGLSSRSNCHLYMLLLIADLVQEATSDTCPHQTPLPTIPKEVKR